MLSILLVLVSQIKSFDGEHKATLGDKQSWTVKSSGNYGATTPSRFSIVYSYGVNIYTSNNSAFYPT